MAGDDSEAAQAEAAAFLADVNAHGGLAVEVIVTPTSRVFLAGGDAYKLKRARTLPFLDYSTLEKRHALTVRELELNRRTAPELYLEVLPVTRRNSTLFLGGDDEIVDWVLHMRRFAADALADAVARRGEFTPAHAAELADLIVDFHGRLDVRHDKGAAAAMARAIEDVAAAIGKVSDAGFVREAHAAARELLADVARHSTLLDQRRDAGLVRLCHGDMHLGNIVFLEGRPTPFDAIEFSDDIACVDVLYDLAFPVMDLAAHALPAQANALLNRYLMATRDMAGLAVMPLFLGARALIRAMTHALSGRMEDARHYLQTLHKVGAPRTPWVVAVGGLSGSGKSTVARALALDLALPPGALLIRSDEVRKRLCGKRPEDRLDQPAYAPAVSKEVFAIMREDAARALTAGWPVILDATHMAPTTRQLAEDVARSANAPFCGLWLAAPADVLRRRVGGRGKDISDADLAVLEKQLAVDVGDIGWTALDAALPVAQATSQARALAQEKLRLGSEPGGGL